MKLKEDLVLWYAKNIIAPNFVKYNHLGFVITEQSSKYGHTFQRDLFLSEELLIAVEDLVCEKMSNGKELLYQIGKNFGWNYGKSFNMPTLKDYSEKEVADLALFLSKFVGATWAKRSDIKSDVSKKYFEIHFNDYVICSKNGKGYMLGEGGLAGLWGWLMDDFSIEGTQLTCEGRGDKECCFVCAPRDYFKSKNIEVMNHDELIEHDNSTHEYLELNKIRPTQFSGISMKEMISENIVKYSGGKMTYQGDRYFPLDINFLYLIEYVLGRDEVGASILFDSSRESALAVAKKEGKNFSTDFISDFMAAHGWGDLHVSSDGKEVSVNYFPWHELYDEVEFNIFRGLLSGFLCQYMNKSNLKVRIEHKSVSSGLFSMNLVVE